MNTQIKMIVTDLDGTLLKTDKTISKRAIAVLEKCRSSGIKVCYATGRGPSIGLVTPDSLFDGKITMNGAYAIADNVVVYKRFIHYKTARPFLMECDKYGLKASSESGGMHYSNFDLYAEWQYIMDFEIVDFAVHKKDAEKLIAVVNNQDDVSFINEHLPDDLYCVVSRDNLAMIMHREATKSKAVEALARTWNIAPSEIAAFGDDVNDIDMLKFAGTGIVMENAVEEVKSIADYICKGNDDDGLAIWIEENIF